MFTLTVDNWINCSSPLQIQITAQSTFPGSDSSGKNMCPLGYTSDELDHPIQDIWLIKKDRDEVHKKNWHCLSTAIQTLLVAISDFYKKNNLEERLKRIERTLYDVKCYFKAGLEE